jgi:pyruvate/2-oxoglutarate dehydrogenase complex dihydrolipoamide dehydrogenase (E3) component
LDDPERSLLENVRPPSWRNPEPARLYDLVVLGAGTAGLVAAAGAATLGARVALVERARLGGDCLNAGCVPSKSLLRAARTAAAVRGAREFGVIVRGGVEVDFGVVMERMRRVRAQISASDSAERFRRLGVDVFFGEGRFVSPDSAEVAGRRLRFRRALIATGARPAAPPIPGLAEAGYLTNETVFSLAALPRRLAVIGAGPLGCELAQAFARFGAEVHLLEALERILPREDRDAAERVAAALLRDGIRLACGRNILRVERRGDEKVLHLECPEGYESVTVDEILVGVGRSPNVEGLGLEAAGVEFDGHSGVKVDDRLRTTNRRIFAAGDVCSRYQFTHNSDFQARIALRNALFFGRARASALRIPRVTYTDPEVAHVGLSAEEAADRGLRVDTLVQSLEDVDRSVLDGTTEGFVKVHLRRGRDEILGATIVATRAGELVSELTLAIQAGVGLAAIGRTVHPYPTEAEAIRKLADAYERRRLTPLVRGILRARFRWLP